MEKDKSTTIKQALELMNWFAKDGLNMPYLVLTIKEICPILVEFVSDCTKNYGTLKYTYTLNQRLKVVVSK